MVGKVGKIAGVTAEEMKILKEILKDYPWDFYAYGSRVKGGFHPTSDLDILIKNPDDERVKVSLHTLSQIKEKLYNSRLPFMVSFTDFAAADSNFIALIKNDLVKI